MSQCPTPTAAAAAEKQDGRASLRDEEVEPGCAAALLAHQLPARLVCIGKTGTHAIRA